MRKFFLPVFFLGMLVVGFLTISVDVFSPSTARAQDAGAVTTTPQIEITGVTVTELPAAAITANVVDTLGQPVVGLTAENFTLSGALADVAQIVSVENITADNLPFSVVLVVDTSSSMAGNPITRSQEAAIAFIAAMRDEDSVAVIGFNDDAQVYQDFTTDRDALQQAILNIPFGGETALYEGALVGVQTAANAPTARRVVILLSDGAEYGNTSNAARPDAGELARAEGVPVYAIGLGFGTDRTYLEELSGGTNARFYESPTPEELTAIYEELAALLRSLYVITLDVDVPADGTEYAFDLQATTPQGDTNIASSVLRAPVPIPVVRLDEVPTEPITEPIILRATILADDEIASVTADIDGTPSLSADINGTPVEVIELTRTPLNGTFAVQIDPFLFFPGDITVNVNATDGDGESGSASATVSIGEVPARLTLGTDVSTLGEITEPIEVAVVAEGQTATARVVFTVDGEEAQATDLIDVNSTVGFSFTIDPFSYAPGEHVLGIEVTSAGGTVSTLEGAFSVAALPPVVTFEGVTAGDVIAEPVTFDVNVVGQSPITEIALYGSDTVIGESSGAGITETSATFTIDPAGYFPGGMTLTAVVTDASGQTTSLDVPIEIAALPPTFTVTGIEDGAVVGETIDIRVQVDPGQTSGASVVTTMNDRPYINIEQVGNTFSFGLNPLNFDAATEYTLGITVTNEGGQSASQSFTFSFDPAFYITLTPEPTVDVDSTNAVGTLLAEQTAAAQITADAQSTADADSAANVQATADAGSTADAISAAEEATNAAIQVTRDWFATAAAEATVNAQGTADVRATEAQATLDALSAENETATAAAAVEQSTLDAVSTQDAEATNDVIALTEDAAAQVQITQQQATVNAQATRDAATLAAQATATPESSPTLAAETESPTDEAGQTQGQGTTEATEAATEEPTEEPTAAATEAPTDEPTEEPTDAATVSPTEEDEATPTPTIFDPTATPVEPTDIEAQDAPQADNTPLLVALACGALLVVLLLIWFLSRRNQNQSSG